MYSLSSDSESKHVIDFINPIVNINIEFTLNMIESILNHHEFHGKSDQNRNIDRTLKNNDAMFCIEIYKHIFHVNFSSPSRLPQTHHNNTPLRD